MVNDRGMLVPWMVVAVALAAGALATEKQAMSASASPPPSPGGGWRGAEVPLPWGAHLHGVTGDSSKGAKGAKGVETNGWVNGDQWQIALKASRPFTPEELRKLIRLNAALGRAALVLARPAPSPWTPVKAPWYNSDLSNPLLMPSPPPRLPAATADPGPSPRPKPRGLWEGFTWAATASLLVTLALLVARLTERCLIRIMKRRLANRRARRANAVATSASVGGASGAAPPPYSECSLEPPPAPLTRFTHNGRKRPANGWGHGDGNDRPDHEYPQPPMRLRRERDQPPPYADCLVAAFAKHSGVPTVHLNQRRFLPDLLPGRMAYERSDDARHHHDQDEQAMLEGDRPSEDRPGPAAPRRNRRNIVFAFVTGDDEAESSFMRQQFEIEALRRMNHGGIFADDPPAANPQPETMDTEEPEDNPGEAADDANATFHEEALKALDEAETQIEEEDRNPMA